MTHRQFDLRFRGCSLQLTALVELLEKRDILKQSDVLERMKEVRDRKKAS